MMLCSNRRCCEIQLLEGEATEGKFSNRNDLHVTGAANFLPGQLCSFLTYVVTSS